MLFSPNFQIKESTVLIIKLSLPPTSSDFGKNQHSLVFLLSYYAMFEIYGMRKESKLVE